jgi:uncharacterized protein (TIGR02145 family)
MKYVTIFSIFILISIIAIDEIAAQRDNTTQVVDVYNPQTGKVWMDRNLGANRAATSSTDTEAYGDLFQWGRRADGHQKRNSSTVTTLNSTDIPSHGSFILAPNTPGDWRSPQNNNLWQGVNGVNNPCPVGYRIPTITEWETERQSWSSNNAAGAISSALKLPLGGRRYKNDGSITDDGYFGFYWSNNIQLVLAEYLRFDSFSTNARVLNSSRAEGYSVRCIKDSSTTPPPAPTLLNPTDSSEFEVGEALLSWGNIETADKFTIQVSHDEAFSDLLSETTLENTKVLKTGTVDSNGNSSTALMGNRGNSFAGNLPNVNDELWFQFPVNEINTSTYFRFEPPSGFGIFNVRIIFPDNVQLSSRNIDSPFNYSVPTFVRGTYRIAISVTNKSSIFHNNGTFKIRTSNKEFTENGIDSLFTNVLIGEPGTYYWRVRSINNVVYSDWSTVWMFTTILDTSIESEDHPKEYSLLQNYPNPFNPTTQIGFSLPESQQVTIQVYDVNGRLVAELLNGVTYSAGTHQVSFDGAGISSGIYIYTMRTSSGMSFTRKLILVK